MFDLDGIKKDPITRLLFINDMVPPHIQNDAIQTAKFLHTVDNEENRQFRNKNRNTLLLEYNELERQRALTQRTLDEIAANINVSSATPDGRPQANAQWLHVFTRRTGNITNYTVEDLDELLRFRKMNPSQRANYAPRANTSVTPLIESMKQSTGGNNCMMYNHFCQPSGVTHCKSVNSEDGVVTEDAEGCACNPFTKHCMNLHAHTALGVGSTETLIHNKYARESVEYSRVYMLLKRIEKEIANKLKLLNMRAIA